MSPILNLISVTFNDFGFAAKAFQNTRHQSCSAPQMSYKENLVHLTIPFGMGQGRGKGKGQGWGGGRGRDGDGGVMHFLYTRCSRYVMYYVLHSSAPYIDTHSPYDGVRRLLQFDHEKVLISLDPNASDMMKFYNQSNGERHIINDGKWYYIMVVYDGSDGHLVVYANNVVVCEVPNYSTGCIFYK